MPTVQKARFRDLTPEHVLVLADQAKEKGLGLAPAAEVGPSGLAYLCYCSAAIETAFTEVFPHRLGRKASACGSPSRLVWLFEEAALRAVLSAFGLAGGEREVVSRLVLLLTGPGEVGDGQGEGVGVPDRLGLDLVEDVGGRLLVGREQGRLFYLALLGEWQQ